jgi:hypothetical protein
VQGGRRHVRFDYVPSDNAVANNADFDDADFHNADFDYVAAGQHDAGRQRCLWHPGPGYQVTVHFSSSDSTATLPGNDTFTASDARVHTLVDPVILRKKGKQSLEVTDRENRPLTATNSFSVV